MRSDRSGGEGDRPGGRAGAVRLGVAVVAAVALAGGVTACNRGEPATIGADGATPGTTAGPTATTGRSTPSTTGRSTGTSTSVVPAGTVPGASGGTSTTTRAPSSTTTAAGGPRIVRFSVTPATGVVCDDAGVGATMSWEVQPADVGVTVEVDGTAPGTASAGYTATMVGQRLPDSFACDGATHTVTLVATGAGGTTRQSVSVGTVASSTHPASPDAPTRGR